MRPGGCAAAGFNPFHRLKRRGLIPCLTCAVGEGPLSSCSEGAGTQCETCGDGKRSEGGLSECQDCGEKNEISNAAKSACIPCLTCAVGCEGLLSSCSEGVDAQCETCGDGQCSEGGLGSCLALPGVRWEWNFKHGEIGLCPLSFLREWGRGCDSMQWSC